MVVLQLQSLGGNEGREGMVTAIGRRAIHPSNSFFLISSQPQHHFPLHLHPASVVVGLAFPTLSPIPKNSSFFPRLSPATILIFPHSSFHSKNHNICKKKVEENINLFGREGGEV
jgi:hypothetical protein